MASLKELRVRIRSVRSTQKITSAMKMVAASRFRRAQEAALAARPYAERMDRMLASLAANLRSMPNAPPLLAGTGKDSVHLLVVATSDRGLAGGFNATILREARRVLRRLVVPEIGAHIKFLKLGVIQVRYLDVPAGGGLKAEVVVHRQYAVPGLVHVELEILRAHFNGQPEGF